jgi:coproporphyrinogen III oxidase
MAVLEGALFEKAGVNVSTVFGTFSPEFAPHIPGTDTSTSFWASGISLVIHPRSPYVPIIHMNTRHIVTEKAWFGGGIDLTPAIPQEADTAFFHAQLEAVCAPYDPTFYPRFKQGADDYFFIAHRKEPRGVGGIFYDYLAMQDWAHTMAFTRAVGEAFLPIYSPIVQQNWRKPWGEEERALQMKKRSRYVEFNLVYDRGTLFGLKTGGHIEAILMSLPPQATWPSPFAGTSLQET